MLDISKITTILFDFDGVIADSEQNRFNYTKNELLKLNIKIEDYCRFEDVIGLTGSSFFNTYFPDLPPIARDKIINDWRNICKNNFAQAYDVIPYMKETIRDLHHKGYALVLVTGNYQEKAEWLLHSLHIREYFEHVFGKEDAWNEKEMRKEYSFIPTKINKTTNECVVIEDSVAGITGAQEAGLACIAFGRYLSDELIRTANESAKNYIELREIFNLDPLPLRPTPKPGDDN